MYYSIYASSAAKDLPDNELMDIKQQSKTACDKLGLTGMLVFHRSVFIHCYEGERDAIKKMHAAIGKDKRHKDIKVIGEGSLDERLFPGWAMELRVLDKDPLFSAAELKNDGKGIKKLINDYFLKVA